MAIRAVAPLAGARIEIWFGTTPEQSDLVAPLAGARIEIRISLL